VLVYYGFGGIGFTKPRSLQEPGPNSGPFLRQISLRTGCSSGVDEPANGLKIVHRRKRQSEINRDEQQEDLPQCPSDGLLVCRAGQRAAPGRGAFGSDQSRGRMHTLTD
jgi:hypothetical protein